MLSVGLWRWYINITITILKIVYRTLFYLKHNNSETVFCLLFQVKPTRPVPIDKADIYHHLKMETEFSLRNAVFQIKDRTMDDVKNRDSYNNVPSSQK
jgi:hypothetical protein